MRSDQILLILALGIFQSVSSFDCYVGGESSYQPTSCFSCQVRRETELQSLQRRRLPIDFLQSVSCLCMSASPVVQYTNSKYDTSQDVLFSSSRNSEGRSQSRLPTYSQTFLEGRQLYSHEHQDNRLQGYTNQVRFGIFSSTDSRDTPTRSCHVRSGQVRSRQIQSVKSD